LVAVAANGLEFLHFFCLRDQLEDNFETCAQEGTIKGTDDDKFPLVGGAIGPFNDLYNEKMRFGEILRQGRTGLHRLR
jgi:hypothetical protein